MKKFLVAALAASSIVAPAFSADISVQRQTFLDQYGYAPQTLGRTETANVSASGTIGTYACVIDWGANAPTAAQIAAPAPNNTVPDASVNGTTATFSSINGTVLLTYTGRVNKTSNSTPNGMALGDAFYEGSFASIQGLAAPTLSCPEGGSVTLGYNPGTRTPIVQGVSITVDGPREQACIDRVRAEADAAKAKYELDKAAYDAAAAVYKEWDQAEDKKEREARQAGTTYVRGAPPFVPAEPTRPNDADQGISECPKTQITTTTESTGGDLVGFDAGTSFTYSYVVAAGTTASLTATSATVLGLQ